MSKFFVFFFYKDYADKPFEKFLASRKLPPKLQHFLLHSVAMANEFMLTEEVLFLVTSITVIIALRMCVVVVVVVSTPSRA